VKPSTKGSLFNLSHDDDLVVLGTSGILSVGVDVMKIKVSVGSASVDQMLSNLRSIFSDREWGYIQTGGEDVKLERFHRLWTAKEAYVKCLGTGLYVEPQELELFGFEGDKLFVRQKGNETRSSKFVVRVFPRLLPGYMLSICVGPPQDCDASWTQFLDDSLVVDFVHVPDFAIGTVSHFSLSQLVNFRSD
jgi:phosphopantetheine--protein transferase-like protein